MGVLTWQLNKCQVEVYERPMTQLTSIHNTICELN